MVGEGRNRIMGAAVAPTGRKVLYIVNVYGWGCHYEDSAPRNQGIFDELMRGVGAQCRKWNLVRLSSGGFQEIATL